MSINQKDAESLTQTILQLVEDEKPKNVQQLINLIKAKASIPEQKIIEYVLRLQQLEKITLKEPTPTPKKLVTYLKTREVYWYWMTLVLMVTTTITIFTIPENLYPLVYIRNVLGAIFILWLPGYSFIRALFPKEISTREDTKYLGPLERIVLSFVMSIVFVSLVGLLLNFTWLGIRLIPIVLCLLLLTTIFSTVAITREHIDNLRKVTE